MPAACHFVTFRLVDIIPKFVRDQLKVRRHDLLAQAPPDPISPSAHREQIHKTIFVEYEAFLDKQDSGVQWLKDARIASLVRSSLHFLHGKKYFLFAYCIMPNHVHALFQPLAGLETRSGEMVIGESEDARSPLSSIMHSLKSYTAHEANKLLHRKGQFWQHESYDHWVRDAAELERIVHYINANPVRALLVDDPVNWFWGSAHERYLLDGERSGWLRLRD